jgi:transcriptional regulator with PAS, ATPase and Fis domain
MPPSHHGLNLVNARCAPEHAVHREQSSRTTTIIGNSAAINNCLNLARKSAASRSSVLLLGESGTGKEVFARAMHDWSERRNGPFVAINCVGLSRDLLESELFGHEKGAFTGAYQLKKGKMELAHGGTVLLDEIGDIAPDLQTRLLRFLQEREFERIGGLKPIPVDVRIIAATNRKLENIVNAGRFREDLFYRLNVISIELPPLRERREDIAPLARHFLDKFSADTSSLVSALSAEAMKKLCAYDWPGNVRELANVMEQAVVLGQGPVIEADDLPRKILSQAGSRLPTLCYRVAVNGFRKELVDRALALSHGNQAAAARLLGLHQKYLQRLIKALQSA